MASFIEIPLRITQGDSVTISGLVQGYLPSEGWFVHLAIRGEVSLDIIGTSSGDIYTLTLMKTDTAKLSKGVYRAILYVTRDLERITIKNQEIEVQADPLSIIAGTDLRTHEERMLDAIEAFMENRATKNQLDHLLTEIDGKKLQRMSMIELLTLRDHYKNKVLSQKCKAPKRFQYRFTR